MLPELACAFSALYMTGVIWFVQVVHYPLFLRVGEDGWGAYHAQHTQRTGWVVAPVMIVELASAAILVLEKADALAVAGLVLAALTWVFTFGLAVPRHSRLEHGFDARLARQLVTTGWLRCAAWTAHGVVALALLQAR